ncbi:hypothetical protein BDR06DRAFT_973268 [Suillus hirtellus]|nr:hypothetical protein BDR06DRAFT_973268 [Suillus hirtellus]
MSISIHNGLNKGNENHQKQIFDQIVSPTLHLYQKNHTNPPSALTVPATITTTTTTTATAMDDSELTLTALLERTSFDDSPMQATFFQIRIAKSPSWRSFRHHLMNRRSQQLTLHQLFQQPWAPPSHHQLITFVLSTGAKSITKAQLDSASYWDNLDAVAKKAKATAIALFPTAAVLVTMAIQLAM